MMEIFMILFFIFMVNMLDIKLKKKILFSYNLCFFMSFLMLFKCKIMNFFWISLVYYFGVNYYSYGLIMLVFWILGLMFMSLEKEKLLNYCMNIMFILLIMLLMTFMAENLFLYYLMFEFSLIPTFMLIIMWGNSFNRLMSAYYMMFYMMIFSMPMLIYLFYMNINYGSVSFKLSDFIKINVDYWILSMLMFSFLVKIPIYLMHSWLLKAHVEAPVFGSMILAALLLKMGGYGLLMLLKMCILLDKFNLWIMSLSMFGMLFISLICLRQVDMKLIVAYSSVVHMGMMIVGLFSLYNIGFLGAYIMMISHGLCSSGLFYMINEFYKRSGSRCLMINKGLINYLPIFCLMWFLLCSSNMSAPLSMNLVGEIMLLISIYSFMNELFIFLMIICFFMFLYSLYLYSYVQHGMINNLKLINMGKLKEYLIVLIHWIPLNVIILNLFMF